MNLAWITTWNRVCGIADYSKGLFPAVQERVQAEGGAAEVVSLDEFSRYDAMAARLRELQPDVVHFQHEYGIYGGKNPPFYFFPTWARRLREALPGARIVATAHTILPPGYRFEVAGRGWQVPLRMAANALFLGRLHRLWGPDTWGALDGVVVHSRFQVGPVKDAGTQKVATIPHFVAEHAGAVGDVHPILEKALAAGARTVLVFGFFSREKGQDVAISAFGRLPADVHLILAGGVRRAADEAYFQHCLELAKAAGVADRVHVTGYVQPRFVDAFFERVHLVLAPFRETSGSGSLAQALGRGAATLASDLPLNREIAERQPGALEFYRTEDPSDCARAIGALLGDEGRRSRLRDAALLYAKACSPARIAEEHLRFYRSV